MLWDQGTWESVGDPQQDYERGRLKYVLDGGKLNGGWMLVRGGKSGDTDERHWFLFKERNKSAQPDRDIVAEEPLSISSGWDLDEIAREATRIWGPHGEMSTTSKTRTRNAAANAAKSTSERHGISVRRRTTSSAATRSVSRKWLAGKAKPTPSGRAKTQRGDRGGKEDRVHCQTLITLDNKRSAFPSDLDVELATLVKDAPAGDNWFHEIKFDGYRMLCCIRNKTIQLLTRNSNDWTSKFPGVVKAAEDLNATTAVLDGEVVVLQADGTTTFQGLQNAIQQPAADCVFYVFDLLYLNGLDTRSLRLEERKELLHLLIPATDTGVLRFSEHVEGDGPEFFRNAASRHLEGTICKRRDSPYRGGRGNNWLKVKCSFRKEFVVGGFTRPNGSRSGFGALLVEYYNSRSELIYAGRVGTGFNQKTLKSLTVQLTQLTTKESPFSNLKSVLILPARCDRA